MNRRTTEPGRRNPTDAICSFSSPSRRSRAARDRAFDAFIGSTLLDFGPSSLTLLGRSPSPFEGGFPMLRVHADQVEMLGDDLLPEGATALPEDLAALDQMLSDFVFHAPSPAEFDRLALHDAPPTLGQAARSTSKS